MGFRIYEMERYFLGRRITEISAGVWSSSTYLLFDTQQLVILGQSLGTARSSGLNLKHRNTKTKNRLPSMRLHLLRCNQDTSGTPKTE